MGESEGKEGLQTINSKDLLVIEHFYDTDKEL